MPKRVTQVAALSGFILLLIVFVAYRSGAFDRYLGPAKKDHTAMFLENNAANNAYTIAIDSPPPVPDSARIKRQIMHGSKSGAVFEPLNAEFKADSVKTDTVKKTRIMMGGSKSAPVIRPPDTTKKSKPDTIRRRTNMSSTKSGFIIRPVWTDNKGDIVAPTWNGSLRKWKKVKEDHEQKMLMMMSGSKSGFMYDDNFFREEREYQLARAIETGIILPRDDSAKRRRALTPRN